MPRGISSVVVFVLLSAPTAVAELSVEEALMQTYLRAARKAIEGQDSTGAQAALDKMSLLETDQDLDLPEEFYFRSAQVALQTRRAARAAQMATRYLKMAGHDGDHYTKALELLNTAVKTLTEGRNGEENESAIRFATGGGIAWLKDDYTDFKSDGDRIYVENDSRIRPEFLFGLLIKAQDDGPLQKLNLSVNVTMTEGGTNILDGVFLGAGWKISESIVLVGGYSRKRGMELSPGFQRAMSRAVRIEQQENPNGKYGHIRFEHGLISRMEYYDGLEISKEVKEVFPGDALIGSYNTKWSFGIMVKFDIWKRIKEGLGKAKQK